MKNKKKTLVRLLSSLKEAMKKNEEQNWCLIKHSPFTLLLIYLCDRELSPVFAPVKKKKSRFLSVRLRSVGTLSRQKASPGLHFLFVCVC